MSSFQCALCRDIYVKGGSVESFIAHYNKDHFGQNLPFNCPFPVWQCELCNLVTKTQRGLTRHIRAKHIFGSSFNTEDSVQHEIVPLISEIKASFTKVSSTRH